MIMHIIIENCWFPENVANCDTQPTYKVGPISLVLVSIAKAFIILKARKAVPGMVHMTLYVLFYSPPTPHPNSPWPIPASTNTLLTMKNIT
jgi:hypothetical protein